MHNLLPMDRLPMNLLTDPIFRMASGAGMERISLPALLAALGRDRVVSLPGLQRHQEDAFHMFLCYLGGACLAREGSDLPCQDEDFWRSALRHLAGGGNGHHDFAWFLVVPDSSQPAFMQAPLVTARELVEEFRSERHTPDSIDILLTAKNHDIKAARSMVPSTDEWVYALVSLQTMSGYVLKHQGIARMNSGLGSRACVSLQYGGGMGQRWSRDTQKLLALRPELLRAPWPYRSDGIVLTWLFPWNRRSSLDVSQLDPFFIEVSRGIRLMQQDGRIVARTSTEQSPRINAKAYNGVLGDPWIPVNRNDPKKGQSALTVGASGFTTELLRNLMFEDGFQLTSMQRPEREEESCQFTATVLVRGQGTTDGFRTVAIPVPGSAAAQVFHSGPKRERLAEVSKKALTDAAELQNRALKPAVLSLLQAGADRIDFDKREISVWWQQSAARYVDVWGEAFFPWLWKVPELPDDEEALRLWHGELKKGALASLEDALSRYPGRNGRRFRAQVRAENIFFRNLYRVFPTMKETFDDTNLYAASGDRA